MDNFMFVVKTFAATLLIIMLMQIKWGEQTIDETVYGYMQGSSILAPVSEAATGGVMWIKHMMTGVGGSLQQQGQGTEKVETKSERRSLFNFKRHNDTQNEASKPKKARFTSWVSEEE